VSEQLTYIDDDQFVKWLEHLGYEVDGEEVVGEEIEELYAEFVNTLPCSCGCETDFAEFAPDNDGAVVYSGVVPDGVSYGKTWGPTLSVETRVRLSNEAWAKRYGI
jgi:hypothetical protein